MSKLEMNQRLIARFHEQRERVEIVEPLEVDEYLAACESQAPSDSDLSDHKQILWES